MDSDGTILARNTIGAGRQDICHYLNNIKLKDNISVAMEASYNWQYAYGIVEGITDSIVLAHPLKTRIIGEAKIKTS